LMGGSIGVESTLGVGSRFRVVLPVELDESRGGPAEPEIEQIIGVELDQPDCRVLIVENEEENWILLQRLLQNAGIQVRVAANGALGVEMFQSWRPQLIFMDLRMPVMDGREATRRIRALEGGKEVKIAAVTASVFSSDREEVLAAGVDDFIRKPYRPSEIFDCMARHLGLRCVYRKPVQKESPVVLRKEYLRLLPHALRRELADAVVTLNRERIQRVIARISEYNETTAYELTSLADRFAYTAILKAANEGEMQSQNELPEANDPRC